MKLAETEAQEASRQRGLLKLKSTEEHATLLQPCPAAPRVQGSTGRCWTRTGHDAWGQQEQQQQEAQTKGESRKVGVGT
jgi:hypothetical protein